jgi:hypothetical protein
MPKERAQEARYNFSGGVNYSASQDTLATNELLLCRNARVNGDGSVERRTGIDKQHAAAFTAGGAPSNANVVGITQWVPVSGTPQLVAIAGAKLWYSNNDGVTWTSVAPGAGNLSTTVMADFQPMVIGSAPLLFIASGSDLFTWDGTAALTKRDLVNSIPNCSIIRLLGNRMFYNSTDDPGFLYWSKLGDGTIATVGGKSDGGFAAVNADSDEPLIALEVLGSSLLIATRHGISRFTGTADDIQILTDTEGVTNTIGPVYNTVSGLIKAHPGSFRACGQAVMMWTDRGPYIVTEAGVVPIGDKINTEGGGSTEVTWRDQSVPAYVVYHRQRMETWFIFRSMADTAAKSAFIFNHRRQCWSGPFQFPVGITSVCEADIAGVPTILGGCDDGFVRLLDDPTRARDDGTTDYVHTIQWPPFIFDNAGPHNTKSLRSVFLQLQRQNTATLPTVKVYADNGAAVTATLVTNPTTVNAPSNMRYDLAIQGKRFVVEVSGSFVVGTSGDDMQVMGVIVDGNVMERW